ncbi:MAG TPA: GAF domain-containing protein, partial [Anaerolineales bacterium]|nr:GAF domain-containing protein [Anaerolineales bacterium]
HAHIYLLDEATGDLIMTGGTGVVGHTMLARHHKVPKEKGLVGRAAMTNHPVLVPDTAQDPGWLPNPLLPETRSEVAVPISIGNRVLGVLDVQNNTVNGLKQADADLLLSIARQVAIGLENARTYTETHHRAEYDEMQTTINQKIQSAPSVELALEITAREIGRTFGLKETRVVLDTAMIGTPAQN